MSRLSLALILSAVVAAGAGPCTDIGLPRASAPVDTTAGEVRFRLAGAGGAAIVVPVFIDGRGPYDLILDTGATFTCVDTSLARALDLPARRLSVGFAVGIGGAGRVELRGVDSLRVGAAVARGLTVCATDLAALRPLGGDVRGLLGLNVLREFRVTLDFGRSVLTLVPNGQAPHS